MSSRNRRKIPNKIPSSALHPLPDEPADHVDFLEDGSPSVRHFMHSNKWEYSYKCGENCADVSSRECSTLSVTNSTVRGTSSTSSWTDDECEKCATQNVRCMLDELEEILYNNMATCDNENLVTESFIWKKHFPHFRIIGKKLLLSSPLLSTDLSSLPSTSLIPEISDCGHSDAIPDLCLQVQGVSLNASHLVDDELNLSDTSHISQEETVFVDGVYEEVIAVDNSDDWDAMTRVAESNETSEMEVVDETKCDEEFEEAVMNVLIAGIWDQFVVRIEALLNQQDHYKSDFLPADHAEEYILPVRMKREISSAAVTHFYPQMQFDKIADLRGILQVSSKILMNRGEAQKERVTSSRVTRGQNTAMVQPADWTIVKTSTSGRLAPLQQSQFVAMSASALKDSQSDSVSWGRNATLPPIDAIDPSQKGTNTSNVSSLRFSSALLELPNCTASQFKGANFAHGPRTNLMAPTSAANRLRHVSRNNFEKAEPARRDFIVSGRLNSSHRLSLRSTGPHRLASVRSPSARKFSASHKNIANVHLSVQNFLLDK